MRSFIKKIESFCGRLSSQLFRKKSPDQFILDHSTQIKSWKKANEKMGWGIRAEKTDLWVRCPSMVLAMTAAITQTRCFQANWPRIMQFWAEIEGVGPGNASI